MNFPSFLLKNSMVSHQGYSQAVLDLEDMSLSGTIPLEIGNLVKLGKL